MRLAMASPGLGSFEGDERLSSIAATGSKADGAFVDRDAGTVVFAVDFDGVAIKRRLRA